jgi:glycogen debranching enzyme
MLEYVAHLHELSIHAPRYPFTRPWEEIGPGYQNSPAFGHWDIVHAILDVVEDEPEHALSQIENELDLQMPSGFLPAAIWMKGKQPSWSLTQSHPPVWPVAVCDYVRATSDRSIVASSFAAVVRQIKWFENDRKADGEGYFYSDILTHEWESGVDEGIRFLDVQQGAKACIDATSHVAMLYRTAAEWARGIGRDGDKFQASLDELAAFMQRSLFDEETGFFHDIWGVNTPSVRTMSFEGFWPLVAGVATPEQAMRVIDENLLCEHRFFAPHPITTVGRQDPRFGGRMWRGPAWNSMTYWAARGCMEYDRPDAASVLLERALDSSARQFNATGTIWEFYDPFGGDPRNLERKPGTNQTCPCSDYLGHNPLIAMSRMWERTR